MDDRTQALAAVDAADKAFTEQQTAAYAAKKKLFDACANAVKVGISPDELADRIRSRKTPEQIKDGLAFTAAYIRRKARDRGALPLKTGPKPGTRER